MADALLRFIHSHCFCQSRRTVSEHVYGRRHDHGYRGFEYSSNYFRHPHRGRTSSRRALDFALDQPSEFYIHRGRRYARSAVNLNLKLGRRHARLGGKLELLMALSDALRLRAVDPHDFGYSG